MRIHSGLVAVTLAGMAAVGAPVGQAEAGAREAGTWLVRGGISNINPKSENLALGGEFTGAFLEVDDAWGITFNGSYFISSHFAVELLLALPYSHDIDVKTPDGSLRIGKTKQLPPTLSAQYHFALNGPVQPYLGVGLNLTRFFSEELTDEAKSLLEADSLGLDSSTGLAWQAGVDWDITDQLLVNLDVRLIDIDTDARIDGVRLGTVEIDPVVIGLNVGWKF